MPATKRNYKVELNANLRIPVVVKDSVTKQVVDLTGYTAKLQARPTQDITSTPLYIDAAVGSGITLTDPVNGRLDVNIPKATIVELTFKVAYYDLTITGPTGTDRILEGNLTVSPGVAA